MSYQLVFKVPGDLSDDPARFEALEDDLQEALMEVGEIDGHDSDLDQTFLFVCTSKPKAAFRAAKPVLQAHHQWERLQVAYREGERGEFVILWPVGSEERFVLT